MIIIQLVAASEVIGGLAGLAIGVVLYFFVWAPISMHHYNGRNYKNNVKTLVGLSDD